MTFEEFLIYSLKKDFIVFLISVGIIAVAVIIWFIVETIKQLRKK